MCFPDEGTFVDISTSSLNRERHGEGNVGEKPRHAPKR
jgi:hypothetical protein